MGCADDRGDRWGGKVAGQELGDGLDGGVVVHQCGGEGGAGIRKEATPSGFDAGGRGCTFCFILSSAFFPLIFLLVFVVKSVIENLNFIKKKMITIDNML